MASLTWFFRLVDTEAMNLQGRQLFAALGATAAGLAGSARADTMGRKLGQSVLIDNRPGAGGVVGMEAVLNAPADGYTIVMASFTVAYVAPLFAGKQPMLPMMAPVSILTTTPTLVVTRADSRFT